MAHDFSVCPRCGATLKRTIAINDEESQFWLECPRCNTYVNTYVPQPHQLDVHEDAHKFIGNFGGYGTGKTLTSREEIYKHLLITPNANILIGANVASQYEQTIKRDIESDFPKAFVKKYNTQKQYIDFINGARIIYRPMDDVDKLRSYNITMFVIVEASEVDAEVFVQLKTRLRNLAAAQLKKDAQGNLITKKQSNGAEVPIILHEWTKGIIESNPDSGWVRTEVVYVSDTINKHGHIVDEINVPDDVKDPAIATHVSSTDCNAYLPSTFIEDNCKNKPEWWIRRFIFSSFSYAEGLVYPAAMHRIVPTYDIDPHWLRIVAADYGLSDDFVYLFGAINQHAGKVVIYKEVRTNNKNIKELSKIFHDETSDIPVGGYYCPPILDPKSGIKRDYNKKTLYDHFLDYGISFIPGHVSVDARVYRTNTYLESGMVDIMDCCTGLIEELRDYKFPPKKIGDYTKKQDKPEDKNNHAINPLEWICMALPADPAKLIFGAYDKEGREDTFVRDHSHKNYVPVQLMDEDDYEEPETEIEQDFCSTFDI